MNDERILIRGAATRLSSSKSSGGSVASAPLDVALVTARLSPAQKQDDDRFPDRRLSFNGSRPRGRGLRDPYARPVRRRDRCRLSPAPVSLASIRPNDEVIETEPLADALMRGGDVCRFGVTER